MQTHDTVPHEHQRARYCVLHAQGELRVVARQAFDAGDTILALEGRVVSSATRHTIQLGPAEHLQAPEGTPFLEQVERYPWLYLNHACRPNAAVAGRALVALRRIEAFDELSFDYETTEWELAEPFTCRCGSCDGRRVRGFRHLDRAERARRIQVLSAHLLARFADSVPD